MPAGASVRDCGARQWPLMAVVARPAGSGSRSWLAGCGVMPDTAGPARAGDHSHFAQVLAACVGYCDLVAHIASPARAALFRTSCESPIAARVVRTTTMRCRQAFAGACRRYASGVFRTRRRGGVLLTCLADSARSARPAPASGRQSHGWRRRLPRRARHSAAWLRPSASPRD